MWFKMNNPLFRPPAEADSLILQVVSGCPHNSCTFCGMYKTTPYRRRTRDDILKLIAHETRRHSDTRRVFLADGDVMNLPFDEIRFILQELQQALPSLSRVKTYANGSSILAKSPQELEELRQLKLQILYMGLESGDADTLQRMHKNETVDAMVEAGCRAQAAGLKMSVMILLGLGGTDRRREHALATADALTRMQPRILSALRIVPVPGTGLHEEIAAGRFALPTEYEVVEELRWIVEHLALSSTVFRANHTSNIIPLEARLPRDQAALLATLDELLASGTLDRATPGSMPMWL